MKLMIGLFPIILSCLFVLLAVHPRIRIWLDIFAYVCLYGFGTIIAFTVYDVLLQQTVFMTTIHRILLNPLFLLTGAYIGIYFLYLILYKLISSIRN
ncbi:hypothetical protein CN326_20690 [Bacillus sp. AFS018417]|uniref:hypothetical protein n=1 Tax=unclassified Bacillus (in: firmicutes) TaxID=185979 RepID=UPI000BF937E3|nr:MULTISPECIES: hypothetical protein [unclassified Bacillus (in: firmicutes)]MCP1123525.1 hypothetical protein [Bacillus sp. 3103sda1]PEZ02183.1 hypothetical protein CN326_20690 [Bacillus sp. AFS018417]